MKTMRPAPIDIPVLTFDVHEPRSHYKLVCGYKTEDGEPTAIACNLYGPNNDVVSKVIVTYDEDKGLVAQGYNMKLFMDFARTYNVSLNALKSSSRSNLVFPF